MAQPNDEDQPISKQHKLKWTTAKKEEYKTDTYDVNNENDWHNIPLFSNVLDPQNPQAAAIMALQKKEKPKNRAKTFKTSGNKAYLIGKGRYKDAITYYTQALNVKCKDKTLNSTIYANRAQIQLCLKNYGKVISDCNHSISLQANTYKSYWRAAIASKALLKYTQAIKYCTDGIIIMQTLIENEKRNPTPINKLDKKRNESSDSSSDSEQSDEENNKKSKKKVKSELEKLTQQFMKLKDLKQKCVSETIAIEKKNESKKQKEMELKMKKENENMTVMNKLKERGIEIGMDDKYNLNETYGKKYKILYDNKMNKLMFAVLFIYPEYDESDFIKTFGEHQLFMDHFKNMFAPNATAPSWDKQNKYLSHRLCVYYETKDRFVNVNVNKSLKDIVERNDYIISVMPVFFILSKDSDFTAKFLQRKSDIVLNINTKK